MERREFITSLIALGIIAILVRWFVSQGYLDENTFQLILVLLGLCAILLCGIFIWEAIKEAMR